MSKMSANSAETYILQTLLFKNKTLIEDSTNKDPDFQASAAPVSFKFGINASDAPGEYIIIFEVSEGSLRVSEDLNGRADFVLVARGQDWTSFFSENQPRFYHSFWSMLRTFSPQVHVDGSHELFGRHARVWRIVLDRIRDALCGLTEPSRGLHHQLQGQPTFAIDPSMIEGNYATLPHPTWGPCTVYYDHVHSTSPNPQPLILLHTAGADSRQNHAFMLQPALRARCTIYTLDLPSHGRSYPIPNLPLHGAYKLTEDDYVACIALFLQHLRNTAQTAPPIVCGASMAGHVCLALALRASQLNIAGVIPLEAAAHLPLTQPPYEIAHDAINESILNAERVYSMLGPNALHSTSPVASWARNAVWHGYSSQAAGVFQGDLAFYFGGWDGRERLRGLGREELKVCPVVMGTGEWDYSCTWEVGRETAGMIGRDSVAEEERDENGLVKAVRFEVLEGLGHFPLTEDPVRMAAWVVGAVNWILDRRG